MSYQQVEAVDYIVDEEGEIADFDEMDEENHGREGGEMGLDDYDMVCFPLYYLIVEISDPFFSPCF